MGTGLQLPKIVIINKQFISVEFTGTFGKFSFFGGEGSKGIS
jgi:hypothetical protein